MSQVSRNYHVGSWETQLVAPNRSPLFIEKLGPNRDINRSELLRPNHLISQVMGNQGWEWGETPWWWWVEFAQELKPKRSQTDRVTVAIQFWWPLGENIYQIFTGLQRTSKTSCRKVDLRVTVGVPLIQNHQSTPKADRRPTLDH